MSIRTRNRGVVLGVLLAALATESSVAAQQRTPKAPVTRTTVPPADAAQRSEILNSQRWRRATAEFNERLSTLPIYSRKQLETMNAEQAARIAKLPTGELPAMLADLEAKNQILAVGPTQDAVAWLGQIIDEYTPKGLERQFGLKGVPNFTTMTAPQLSEEILKLQKMQADSAQQSAQSAALPRSQANPWDPGAKAAQQAYAQDQHSSGTSYSSPYRSAPSSKKPFADVKTDPNISFSVGAFGRFQMNYNTGSF